MRPPWRRYLPTPGRRSFRSVGKTLRMRVPQPAEAHHQRNRSERVLRVIVAGGYFMISQFKQPCVHDRKEKRIQSSGVDRPRTLFTLVQARIACIMITGKE